MALSVSLRRAAPERRQNIIEAARFLALRHGLRGVTMEAIAREAQVAKPTLYGYFPDKQAVFEAVMEEIIAQFRSAFDEALSSQGEVLDRIARAIGAKHGAVFAVLEGSPHAGELYDEHSRLAGAQFRALEEHIEAAIAGELEAAGYPRAREMTQLLMAAASGIGRKLPPAAIGPAIALLTRRLLGPELD